MALAQIQEYQVKPLLRGTTGVAEVNTSGGYQQQIVIQPDPARLAARGMSLDMLAEIIEQNTRNAGGGYVEIGGEQLIIRATSRVNDIERTNGRGIVGNVYLGRVVRVLPGMQSAFIEIGLERTAFLHVADIWSERINGNGYNSHETRPIERILSEGQSIMVQVQKDPIGTKGARLTTQVSIAGRLLVHLPQDTHIGISQRIDDEAERERLRDRIMALLPADQPGG